MAPAKVSEWSVDQVGDFLQGLQLGGLAPAFKENAVDGKDLLNLTDDDYIRDLKLTNLQVSRPRCLANPKPITLKIIEHAEG